MLPPTPGCPAMVSTVMKGTVVGFGSGVGSGFGVGVGLEPPEQALRTSRVNSAAR